MLNDLTFPKACPECLVGILKPLTYILTSNPPKQPYQCTNCKHIHIEVVGVSMNVGVSDE